MNAALYKEEVAKKLLELEKEDCRVFLVDEQLLSELIYFSALGEINKPIYKKDRDNLYRVLIESKSIEKLKQWILFTPKQDNTLV